MLHEEHGAGYFAIFDANFAQDTARVIAICNEITRRNLNILIDLPTGLPINATATAMVDALAEAGLIRTCISVETGDEFIRNTVMHKQRRLRGDLHGGGRDPAVSADLPW